MNPPVRRFIGGNRHYIFRCIEGLRRADTNSFGQPISFPCHIEGNLVEEYRSRVRNRFNPGSSRCHTADVELSHDWYGSLCPVVSSTDAVPKTREVGRARHDHTSRTIPRLEATYRPHADRRRIYGCPQLVWGHLEDHIPGGSQAVCQTCQVEVFAISPPAAHPGILPEQGGPCIPQDRSTVQATAALREGGGGHRLAHPVYIEIMQDLGQRCFD